MVSKLVLTQVKIDSLIKLHT